MGRRVHSREFKLEAVRLVKERGLPQTQVAQELGVHLNSVRAWVQQFEADPQHAFPGHGQMKPADAELAKLQRELKRVTAERDILKKALGYFAKEPT
jgi:transposase